MSLIVLPLHVIAQRCKFCSVMNTIYFLKSYFNFCLQDIGAGKGKYYAVNFPLRDGIDDESYEQIFNPVS